MNLSTKYTPGERIGGGLFEVFRARTTAGARPVLLHRLNPSARPEQQNRILQLMAQFLLSATPDRRAKVLDSGEWNGFCVITEEVSECLDLARWLESAVGEGAQAAPPPQAPAPSRPGAGEFTQAFGRIVATVPDPPAGPPPPASQGRVGPDDPTQSKRDPGAFTRFFDTRAGLPGAAPSSRTPPPAEQSGGSSYMPPPPPPVTPSPGPGHSEREGGDFTRMFVGGGTAQASPPPPPPPPRQSQSQSQSGGPAPGEFTGMFSGGGKAPPPPEAPHVPESPRGSSPSQGEFTRMFSGNTPLSRGEPTGPPTSAPPPGEFTAMFKGTGSSQAPPPPSAPVAGEFTRTFGSPAVSSETTGATRPPTPPPMASPGGGGSSEFDDWFRSPIAQPTGPTAAMPDPVPRQQQPGGEFTRIFGRPNQQPGAPTDLPIEAARQMSANPAVPERPPVPPAPIMERPAAPPPASGGPSEFTRIISGAGTGLGQPGGGAAGGAPPPSGGGSFGMPKVEPPRVSIQPPSMHVPSAPSLHTPSIQTPSMQAPNVSVQGPQIPSVSTPQVSMQAPQIPSAPPPQAAAGAGAAPASSRGVLIFFIALVVCLAVLLVLYFALKK